MPQSDAVAAVSGPLLDYSIGRRVNPGHRDSENGGPDRSVSEGNFSTPARDTHRDSRHQFVGLRINARDRAVSLIKSPHRACSHTQKTRLRSTRAGSDNSVRLRVDAGQPVVLGGRDPDGAIGKGRSIGAGGYDDSGTDLVRLRIDTCEDTLVVGSHPDAAGSHGDPAFGIGRARGDLRLNFACP